MSELLKRLMAETAGEVARRRSAVPDAALERQLADAPAPAGFADALSGPGLSVIAEMKRRTPLMGTLADDYSPAALAATYEAGGAAALSVLCQEGSFGGAPQHIQEARSASSLPVLRKDFVSTEYQLLEGRVLGADAVLLIAAGLEDGRLETLLRCTRQLGMDALVEVHDAADVDRALNAGATVVGINHRDLNTFAVDTTLTATLRPLIPDTCLVVAESGIATRADAERMLGYGAGAVLVGEALMRAADPAAKVRELTIP